MWSSHPDPFGWGECDRETTNESDGRHFYGYDDEDLGMTCWYDEEGRYDSMSPTPLGED